MTGRRPRPAFLIQRADLPGVWNDLGTVSSPLAALNDSGATRTYVDQTAVAGKGYQYRVVALNTIGYGGEFMSLSAKAPSAPVNVGAAPAAPTGLTATLQAGALSLADPGPRIRLAWTNPAASSANANEIQRCTGLACTNFAVVATVAANATSFVDATATAGATYNYTLRAANGVGYSAFSNTVERAIPALPVASTLLPNPVVTVLNGNNRSVALSWTLNAGTPVATTFTVQRATTVPSATTVWATIATVPGTTVNYLDTGARRATTYWYRIVANYTNVVRISNPSNTIGPVAVP